MDNKILRKVQNIQLEIFIEFDRICRKNNIEYFFFYGSLLGAVRHQGFIPWDDDIDIILLREDYEKLLLIIDNDISYKMHVQSKHSDKESFFNITKIRMKGTYFYEETILNKISEGIYIDIIPLDFVPNGKLKRYLHRKRVNLLHRLKASHLKTKFKFKTPFKSIMILARKLFKIIPLNKYVNKIEKLVQKYNKENNIYLSDLSSGPNDFVFNKEHFVKKTKLVFEQQIVIAPKQYDEVLKILYGDYMKYPKITEQKPQHVSKLSFDGKKFYEGYKE